MAYRISARDRVAFKRCRRAWDLGSRNRQDYEPVGSSGAVDLDRAVHDALAVYYFPGMWEWNRSVVQPLVHQALERSLRGQQDAGADEQACEQALTRGRALLDAYAAWAPTVDNFTPVRIDVDLEVNIPDPDVPYADLVTPDGRAIRYTDRVDLVGIDEHDAYWAIQHRIVTNGWAELDMLQLDERSVVWAWAWPHFYLGMRVVGTVYNEIRVDAGEPEETVSGVVPDQQRMRHRRMYAQAHQIPRDRVRIEGTDWFRRTRITRSDSELAVAGTNLAAEARAATSPDLAVYPSPAEDVCRDCLYRPPCLAMNESGDAAEVLATSYRHRPPEPIEEGRLGGGTWSMNRGAAPPRWGGRPGS
ncbi:MAG: hypothetical protein ACRDT0_09590 [Pseudonocardiaceae bacterium]